MPTSVSGVPETFLNCYEIVNADALRWGVRIHKVRRAGGNSRQIERGEANQDIWDLWKKHKAQCKGDKLVIELDAETVAVSSDWNLPGDVQEGEFRITFDRAFTTDPTEPAQRSLITGILREAIKARFKNTHSDVLGEGEVLQLR